MYIGEWICVEGKVEEDLLRKAHVAMLGNELMTFFAFEEGKETIYAFTSEPKMISL